MPQYPTNREEDLARLGTVTRSTIPLPNPNVIFQKNGSQNRKTGDDITSFTPKQSTKGWTNDSQTKHEHREKLGETLANANVFFKDSSETNADKDSPALAKFKAEATKHAFPDDKTLHDEQANKLLSKEKSRSETLGEANAAAPFFGAAAKEWFHDNPKLKDAATRDIYADEKALHDKQAAKMHPMDQPMAETRATLLIHVMSNLSAKYGQ